MNSTDLMQHEKEITDITPNIELVSPKSGGGQWVRAAISLALSTVGLGIKIANIRSDRPKPGIHDQLESLIISLVINGYLSCRDVTETSKRGVLIGKKEVVICGVHSMPIGSKDNPLRIKTSGSTWLVMQALVAPIAKRTGYVIVNGNPSNFNSVQGIDAFNTILKLTGLSKHITVSQHNNLYHITCTEPFTDQIMPSYDVVNMPVKVYEKDKQKAEEEYKWRTKVKEQTGKCPSYYDNALLFATVFGGHIIIPDILFEKYSMQQICIDSHVEVMISFIEKLHESFLIMRQTSDPATESRNIFIDILPFIQHALLTYFSTNRLLY